VLAASGAGDDAQALLIGGYFGTWHDIGTVAGLPLSAQLREHVGAFPGAGVLVVLPGSACGLRETARVLDYLAGQSAGQCGPCVFGLPAIAADFAQLASGQPGDDAAARLERRLGVLPGRGACKHPDGAAQLAASALVAFADDVSAHARHLPCPAARHHSEPALPVPQQRAEGQWR
jgi:NADH:ubiquinone oxidoreductase subunit F (NADH-binding)